ncbi:MAG: DNA cytosine methyltransferase [Candidatus Omnitrophota bacterium]
MCANNKKQFVNSKIVAIDLFCGAGGVTCGMRKAGIRVPLGVDKDNFKDTYEKNNPGSLFWQADISKISGREIIERVNLQAGEKLLLAACAPCQPFSLQNKKRHQVGSEDKRENLLAEVIRIVDEMERKPDYIFAENVPGIKLNPVFKKFEEYLYSQYYSLKHGVVNAASYGTPQSRRRLILIAKKDGFIDFPKKTHGKGLKEEVTVKKAFKGLPPIKAGGGSLKYPDHICRKLSKTNLERLECIPKDGGSRDVLPNRLVLDCHKKANVHKDVYGRMAWNKPAPTLTTRCICLSNGRFGHPSQNRAISVREAARLQGFPDEYIFYGNGLDSKAKQVGNAVPVQVAEAFGKYFLFLEGKVTLRKRE